MAIPQPDEVRDHFDHDGTVLFIDCGKRSTAAWVRERWNDDPLGAEAVVWDHGCAISCSNEVADRIVSEAPDHWVEYVDTEVKVSA